MISIIPFLLFSLLSYSQNSLASNTSQGDKLPHSSEQNVIFFTLLDSSRASANRDLNWSLYLADQARKYADSLEAVALQVKVFNQYGRLYFSVGLVDISTEYYLKSRELIRSNGEISTKDQLSTSIGLGANYLFLRNFEKAEEFLLHSQQLMESLPERDFRSSSSIANNFGILFREKGDLVRAHAHLDKGIQTLEKQDPENHNLPMLYNNLALVYARMKNYEAAFETFDKAEKMAITLNFSSALAQNQLNKAETYLQKGNLDQALVFARRGFKQAEQSSLLVIQHNCSQFLAEAYKKLGKADSALFFLEVKADLLKQVNNEEADRQLLVSEMREKFQEENQAAFSAFKKINLRLYGIILALFFASALLLWTYLKIKGKYQKTSLKTMEWQLELQNRNLEKQLLKAQLEEKNKQLTAKLLYESRRLRVIKDTVDKLIGHRNEFSRQGKEIVTSVVRDLRQFDQDNILSEFETSFLDLHTDFYKNLLEAFPDLSQNERRLCAFIRLNLNSREISALTGQSSSTLNMARTRLRKKLGLTHSEEDLYDFLSQF